MNGKHFANRLLVIQYKLFDVYSLFLDTHSTADSDCGAMVSELVFRLSSHPCWVLCVVFFLGKALYSHSLSLPRTGLFESRLTIIQDH